MKNHPFIKRTLSNGLRMICVPMPSTQAVTLLVLVGTGSRYETKDISGVSHFMEHLFFKGTKARPNPGDVHRELDHIGAQHNAFTSKEVTGYWVKAAAHHFDIALDVISDILTDPLFKEEEIEKERGVILQEINMYNDNPMRKVYDKWEELLYGDQPAGWDTAGTPETLKKISKNDILGYRDRQYVASNTVVVVAGKIDANGVFKKLEKHLGGFKAGHAKPQKAVHEKRGGPDVSSIYKKTDQTHFIMGVRGYHMYDARRYALNLLGVILGGTTSSRLFHEIREKMGLAYYVRGSAEYYSDTGYFSVSAGVLNSALDTVIRKVLEQFKDVKDVGVTKEEVDFAKDNLRGSLALSFESTDEVASFYGERELFYGKLITPDEIFKKIEKVRRDDIIKVARDIFRRDRLNLAVIGPNRNLKKEKKLLSGFI